jgi:hypothetical protein
MGTMRRLPREGKARCSGVHGDGRGQACTVVSVWPAQKAQSHLSRWTKMDHGAQQAASSKQQHTRLVLRLPPDPGSWEVWGIRLRTDS